MSLWLIIPRDPLVFRDGKPFTNSPGSRAKTMSFPLPATTAGAVRTQAGIDPTTGRFDKGRISDVLQKYVYGPFLVKLDRQDGIADWLFHAPADAVLFETDDEKIAMRHALAPTEPPEGASSDLQGAQLVAFSKIIKDKPLASPPRFWYKKEFLQWLVASQDKQVNLMNLGIEGLPTDSRTHVSIDPQTLAALPGALFQTAGLEFMQVDKGETVTLSTAGKLALAVETDATIHGGIDFLGGERRVVFWKEIQTPVPECPAQVGQKILESRACRLVLLTPAWFENGYLPEWIKQGCGCKADIVAAVVNRYQTISGWDYHIQLPKPTRRLAPAGSVYFLKLTGTSEEIQNFIKAAWMKSVSDDAQSRLDGFGVAVLGSWDGNPREMEAQS